MNQGANRQPTYNAWLIRLVEEAILSDFTVTIKYDPKLCQGIEESNGFVIADEQSKVISVARVYRKPTLTPLKHMTNNECERFLTSLPNVGKKVARCIMMYSLDRQVFPVDTHCWRICRRLGWIKQTRKGYSCPPRDMDRLQSIIPPDLRYSMHVNLVSHGRTVCTETKPRCRS